MNEEDWTMTRPLDKIYDISEVLEEIEAKIHELFGHEMKYKGVIQVFPNATYHIDGKMILDFFNWLNKKKNEVE